ncbi:MAG: GFA family protein [Roseobacter sp.]|jgi:hypothetical protein|nr:GFA family protein [Roseobacter sp.]
MSAPLTGRCLCGAVEITVKGAHDPQPGICHCRMCQRWSGGIFMCFEAAPDAVTVTGEIIRYPSSSFAERAFCQRCGSHLWMRDTVEDAGNYELMPGLFDAAPTWALRSEIYTDRAIAGVQIAGDHPRATGAVYEAKNRFVEENSR